MKVYSPLFAVAIAAAVFAPRVEAACSAAACTVGTDGATCQVDILVPINQPLNIAAPSNGGCAALGQYLSSFKVSAAPTDVFTVTFNEGLTATAADDKDGTTLCKSTYTNVGKAAPALTNTAKSTIATITCKNAVSDCKVAYLPAWTCQSVRDAGLCPKECSDPINCKTATIAANTNPLVLSNPDYCPGKFSYLTSLMAGARDNTRIVVAVTGGSATAATSDASGSCFSQYTQYPVDLNTQNAEGKVTVTCATTTAACTVETYPVWACDAKKCDTQCGTGTGCTDAVIPGSGSFVLKKPADKSCPAGSFAYPTGLAIGGKYADHKPAVTFNNKLTPTPTTADGTCYFAYTDIIGAQAKVPVSSDVEVTVACVGDKSCTAQYKVAEWKCYGPPDVKKSYTRITADPTGDKCVKSGITDPYRCARSYALGYKDGSLTLVPQTAADVACTTLVATGDDAKGYTNTDTTMSVKFDTTTKAMNVKYTAASTVCETIYMPGNFTNPFIERSYMRQSATGTTGTGCGTTTDCPYKCAGDVTLAAPALDKISVTQNAFTDNTCSCTASTTAYLGDAATSATDSTGKIVHTSTPTGMMVVTTNTDSSTCTAVYAGRCFKQCGTGCTDQAITAGGNYPILKPTATAACPTGQFAYPKTIKVGAKDLGQISVAFNNGLKPLPSTTSADCYYEYTDVVGTSQITSDVTATVTCKDPAATCTAQVKVGDWGCYGPPDAAKTYTRSTMTGANCPVKVSECANRCAKSYMIGAKDDQTTFVPQLAPDCNCAPLMATKTSATAATNAVAGMSAAFDTTANTMTLAYSGAGAACSSVYKLGAFTNPFPVKTFTRQNVTPAACVSATDCGYRCGAEIALNKTMVDVITATRTAVANCTCTNTTAYVGDDALATGGDATTTHVLGVTDTGVTVNSTVGAVTCRATYTEKIVTPAPTPTTTAPAPPVTTTPAPTTAKTSTGTSAGVAAAGAGVCTVTLVAAAAGVQAIGLPV